MPSRVTVVPLFHDLLSTPTNQPASLYDEFGYCFEHARLRGRLSLLGVGRSITTGPSGSHYLRRAARASPPFEPDVIEITDAGGVSIIAVAEHGDIDQVRRRHILPDLGVDVAEVDLFFEPTAGPLLASVGNEVREAADIFVLARSQPIAPDHLHRALLATIRCEPKKQSRRVIVAFARALVERAADRQFDVPPPREHRIGSEVDIDMPTEHRGAVMGFEPHARHAVLDRESHAHRRTRPEFPMSPTKGEWIEREGLPEVHHGHDRSAVGC